MRARLAHGIGAGVERRDVHEVQQQARAREMAQELVAEPRALGGALDQPGNVGEHEAAVCRRPHHAEDGIERGEGIVGHLRARGRRPRGSGSTCRRWACRAGRRRRAASARASAARFSPSPPRVNWRGARFMLDLKCRLPRPPGPPLASSARSPSRARSAIGVAALDVAHDGADRHAQLDVAAAECRTGPRRARSRRSRRGGCARSGSRSAC